MEFAKKNEVHVHLVAHPRKGDNDKKKLLTADDIGGSADITNRADNAFRWNGWKKRTSRPMGMTPG